MRSCTVAAGLLTLSVSAQFPPSGEYNVVAVGVGPNRENYVWDVTNGDHGMSAGVIGRSPAFSRRLWQ